MVKAFPHHKYRKFTITKQWDTFVIYLSVVVISYNFIVQAYPRQSITPNIQNKINK